MYTVDQSSTELQQEEIINFVISMLLHDRGERLLLQTTMLYNSNMQIYGG